MKAPPRFEQSYTLSASTVDAVSRVIRGATAAKAGVQAQGKYVFVDKAGKVTYDEKLSVKKLPVFTDEETLETLMGAAQDAGNKVRVRSDHDDSLGARAGFAANFRKVDDRVVVDLHFNKSYRDLDTVMETAATSPELIGCSIDFIPVFVIEKDRALMRVSELLAVDVVDAGAITPAGLFLKRGVDSEAKDETDTLKKNLTMAKADEKIPHTVDDCMSAIAGLSKTVGELSATIAKMSSPPADADKDGMAAVKELSVQLSAIKDSQEKFVAEQKAQLAKISQERQALGLSAEKMKTLETLAEETEKERLAAEAASKDGTPKTYLAAVADKAEKMKLQRSAAHEIVQREHPALYQAHLASKGVVKVLA